LIINNFQEGIMLNLAAVLEHSATELPEKTAIVFGDKRFSYKQINAVANQVANGLAAAGITKGDKVALSCPNQPYFSMIYYGILKTGAAVVPLNVLLKGREIAYHLKDSQAKAYFCFQGTPELPMAREGWTGFNDVPECEKFLGCDGRPGGPISHRKYGYFRPVDRPAVTGF
jgi:long-chain acyl-CoA synthetase